MNVCDEASEDVARGGSSIGGGGGEGRASWKKEGSADLVTKEGGAFDSPCASPALGVEAQQRLGSQRGPTLGCHTAEY